MTTLHVINVQSAALSDRNLLVILGEDGSIWCNVQPNGTPWGAWRPLRAQHRGGFTQIAAVAHPSSGALIAALSTDLALWWKIGDASLDIWSEWISLGSPNSEGGLTNLIGSVDAQGAYVAAAIGLDGAPWLIRQSAAGADSWTKWASPGIPPQTEAVIDIDLAITDQGIHLIALGLDNVLYEIRETGGKWGEWHSLGVPAGNQELYQMTLIADKSQSTIFATSLEAEVWAIRQQGETWQTWFAPEQSGKAINLDLALDTSGLIHAFGIGDDKAVIHLGETAGGWGTWEPLAEPPAGVEFISVSALQDRLTPQLDVFAVDAAGGLWASASLPTRGWGAWVAIPTPIQETMRGLGDGLFPQPPVDLEPLDLSLRYDQCAFLVAHNAFASRAYNYVYSQQALNIQKQLERGVRGLMLDIYENCEGYQGVVLAHGSCEITKHMKTTPCEPLKDILNEVKKFLDSNPQVIITLLFESYVSASKAVSDAFTAAGLDKYIFHAHRVNGTADQGWEVARQGWPTLQWMVDHNQRLVVFSQRPKGGDDGLPIQWDYCVETVYGKRSMAVGCDCRAESKPLSDAARLLFVMNRFPTLSLSGSLLPAAYGSINDAEKIAAKISECMVAANRLPNFVAVDFIDQGLHGGPVKAINQLNRQWRDRAKSVAQSASGKG